MILGDVALNKLGNTVVQIQKLLKNEKATIT